MVATQPPVRVMSFGYLHGAPPAADLVVDVRQLLHDPARIRGGALLDLDGRDRRVHQVVMDTPGAVSLVDGLLIAVLHLSLVARKPVTVAFGCAGGRHRSVALAERLGELISGTPTDSDHRDGPSLVGVTVEHLHVHLPRVLTGESR